MTNGEMIAAGTLLMLVAINGGGVIYGYGRTKESLEAIKFSLDDIRKSRKSDSEKISEHDSRINCLETICDERHVSDRRKREHRKLTEVDSSV